VSHKPAEGEARRAGASVIAPARADETISSAVDASRAPAAQSAVGPSPSDPAPLLGAGVGMQEMIDAIRASVAVASRSGMSQARIALHPAELGEIRIHLSQTSEGLLARVTAGTDEAARGLLDGRGELHRALSTLGVPLLGLDVGSSGDGTAGQRGTAGQALGQPGVRSAGSGGGEHNASGADDIQEAEPAPGLSGGGLVNVLA